jgi:hypothetical protein
MTLKRNPYSGKSVLFPKDVPEIETPVMKNIFKKKTGKIYGDVCVGIDNAIGKNSSRNLCTLMEEDL